MLECDSCNNDYVDLIRYSWAEVLTSDQWIQNPLQQCTLISKENKTRGNSTLYLTQTTATNWEMKEEQTVSTGEK